LSAFVISLLVVGTALVIATRVALSGTPTTAKPATSLTRAVRGPAEGRHLAPEPELEPPDTWLEDPEALNLWQRVRSGVLLLALLTILGALTALVLIVGGAVLLTGLRSAVQ
jgi:hypothetical protein